MKRLLFVVLTSGMLAASPGSCLVRADESITPTRATDAPNAAVIYWQAFSSIPTLDSDQKQKYDAATESPTAPINDELKPIIALFSRSLHEMRRAQAVAPCDWQLDYDAGPDLLLTHLQLARDLSRAGLLRARMRFAAGETDAATSDVLAVLKMARDCGSSPVLIAYLVDVAIEFSAQTVLAHELTRLNADQLDQLAMNLKALPPTVPLTESVRHEGQMFGDWLERRFESLSKTVDDPNAGIVLLTLMQEQLGIDFGLTQTLADAEQNKEISVEEVGSWIAQLRKDYDEIVRISQQAPADQQKQFAEFEAALERSKTASDAKSLSRRLSVALLPSVGRAFERNLQHLLRRELMLLAVQVQRHGPDALTSATDIKVEHHKTAAGFELRAQCLDKTEVLVVGPSK